MLDMLSWLSFRVASSANWFPWRSSSQLSTLTREEYWAVAMGIWARLAIFTVPRAARMWFTLMVVARSGTLVGRLVSLMMDDSNLRRAIVGVAWRRWRRGWERKRRV